MSEEEKDTEIWWPIDKSYTKPDTEMDEEE